MCANLLDPTADTSQEPASQTALAGTLVSSLHRLKDVDNMGTPGATSSVIPLLIRLADGGFFVFGDLSVKVEGQFRLRFSLFEMRK